MGRYRKTVDRTLQNARGSLFNFVKSSFLTAQAWQFYRHFNNLTGSPMFLDFQREFLGTLVFRPLIKGNEHPGYWVRGCSLGGVAADERSDANIRSYFSSVCFNFVYFSAPIADFYSMSYLWFSGLSVLTSFGVGIIMSLILGKFTIDN